MITVVGKYGIKATILADSINKLGNRLITYEIEVPRIVWAEFLTHGALARNAASSRAIPGAKMREQLTGRPVRFGKNVSGMQDGGDHVELIQGYTPEEWWDLARLSAIRFADEYAQAGYHKQVFNRLTEPFQMMKGVVSATELENFFWLRKHTDADPTIEELARVMYEAREQSTPNLLQAGEWHLPYVDGIVREEGGKTFYALFDDEGNVEQLLTMEQARKVSAARCAAVSYRNVDYTLEKSEDVFARLVGADRKHASAFEHQATPIGDTYLPRNTISTIAFNVPHCPNTWQPGISHMDRDENLWSGKFKGWIQHRKLIPGENYTGENQ